MVFSNNNEKKTTKEILDKYGSKLNTSVGKFEKGYSKENFSKSYSDFKGSMELPLTTYERWAKAFGNFFVMKVAEKDRVKIQRNIDIAHLNLSVSEVAVFSVTSLFLTFFSSLLIFVGLFLITGVFNLMLLFLGLIFSLFIFYFCYTIPERLALKWRLKASSQMVPAILYIVIYMKHTSNFEKAVSFAAENLENPLSRDFRKVFWDVEVGRYSTIKESMDNYLETWRDYSPEFIESFHLIESSLYEPDGHRRVLVLEKSLQVILDGVYDRMLKYTHNVKAPLTNLYMLGIVLPTLALAILPLASTMLGGSIKSYHIFFIFNLIIPFIVFYMTTKVMMSRPGGYGESSLLAQNPLYPKYKSKKPYIKAVLMAFPLFILGVFPLIWMYTSFHELVGLPSDPTWGMLGLPFLENVGIFGTWIGKTGSMVGPLGILSLLLSLFVPISIAMVFIIANKERTQELIKSRSEYKNVEAEFTSSLFQLGNRIGDGLPAEIAFAKVYETNKGTATQGFFKIVNENIQQMGMSLENALFNKKRGAVIFYPSQLIATSMKVLIESVKKGLRVAATSLMSISEYVKNIRKIDVRLNDLLADILSDMKSNMTFLAPLLSGIIVGLSGMITTILTTLGDTFDSATTGSSGMAGLGGMGALNTIFNVELMMSTYWLQIIVGLYLIEIVFILTITLVTIKSGKDELQTTSEIGKNLKKAMIFYFIVAAFTILVLSLIGGAVIGNL